MLLLLLCAFRLAALRDWQRRGRVTSERGGGGRWDGGFGLRRFGGPLVAAAAAGPGSPLGPPPLPLPPATQPGVDRPTVREVASSFSVV